MYHVAPVIHTHSRAVFFDDWLMLDDFHELVSEANNPKLGSPLEYCGLGLGSMWGGIESKERRGSYDQFSWKECPFIDRGSLVGLVTFA
jgi:hypothetical protein